MSRSFGGIAIADEDAARVDLFEAGQHAQRGGLAAAGRADEDEELAIAHLEVELVDRGAGAAGVEAGGVVERDRCHVFFSFTGRYVPDDP